MKTATKYLSALVFLVLASAGCTKDNTTALQITILSTVNSPVSNANVTLYKTQIDLQNGTNIQDVQISDNNGNVTFSNLGVNVYYFNVYRSSDCATNAFTTTKTNTLTSGQTNTLTVKTIQIGQETFTNTSGVQYAITIDSSAFQTLNGGHLLALTWLLVAISFISGRLLRVALKTQQ